MRGPCTGLSQRPCGRPQAGYPCQANLSEHKPSMIQQLANLFGRRSLAAAAAVFSATPAMAENGLNMPVGVTQLSTKIYDLHMLIFWVCVWIAVAVFGVMVYSIIKFRKSKGAVADKKLTHSTKVEII